MSAVRLPGLTKRAADALKPFVDEALRLERDECLGSALVTSEFFTYEWIELLAALRESQAVAEGITQG